MSEKNEEQTKSIFDRISDLEGKTKKADKIVTKDEQYEIDMELMDSELEEEFG